MSRSPLAQTASYWAQGGIAAALADDDSPELHAADTLAAGARRRARRARCACCARSRPRACATSRSSASSSTPTASGNLALGLEGGHSRRRVVHAGGAATGRRITRDAVRAAPPRTSASRCSSRVAASALADGTRAAASGSPLRPREGGPFALSARAVILATGGMAALWERTTNPRGAIGAGLSLAERGRRAARRPRVHAVPPHGAAARRARATASSITEAVRGEGALLLRLAGRALRGRARAARRGGARDPDRARADAASRPSGSTCAHVDVDALPEHRGRARGGGPRTRRATCSPSRPRRTTRWAAWPPTSTGARPLPGPVRGRRVRPARACTAPTGWPRTRSPSASSSAAARRSPPPPSPRRAPAPAAPGRRARRRAARRGDARGALAPRRACGATPTGLAELRDDPYPLARLIGAACLAREESRGAHQRTDHPDTDPALDRMHTLVARRRRAAFERWD